MTQQELPGFEEVTDPSKLAAAPAVTLTARDIQAAYEAKKIAIANKARVEQEELHSLARTYYTDEEVRVRELEILAKEQLDLATTEVERVGALAQFFQIEAIFKAQQVV